MACTRMHALLPSRPGCGPYLRLHPRLAPPRRHCPARQPPPPRAFSVTAPLIAADNAWAQWAVLAAGGALGLRAERTALGRALSGPVSAMLSTALLANLGVLPPPGPAVLGLQIVLVKVATPLLLMGADLRRVATAAGRLSGAFLLGSLGTAMGAVVGYALLGGGSGAMGSLGDASGDGWRLAAALCAKNIGGGVNYIAVAASTGLGPAATAAGFAVDNVMALLYFPLCSLLAARAGPLAVDARPGITDSSPRVTDSSPRIQGPASVVGSPALGDRLDALAIAFVIAAVAESLAPPGQALPVSTALTVALATIRGVWQPPESASESESESVPKTRDGLVSGGDDVGRMCLYVYFASVGASGGSVAAAAPYAAALFPFLAVMYGVHLATVLILGRAAGYSRQEVVLASNANVGGPATAACLATASGWGGLVAPGVLVGLLGNAVATFVALALGHGVLSKM